MNAKRSSCREVAPSLRFHLHNAHGHNALGARAAGIWVALPLILAAGAWALLWAALRPTPVQAQVDTTCDAVSAIPAEECRALVALYQNTDGAAWDDHTLWLTVNGSTTPCDWFGVTCEGGHVTRLELPGNSLRGNLPRALGGLGHLQQLDLSDNLLRGGVPDSLCRLAVAGTQAHLAYNQLQARDARTRACLDHLDPDWLETQTIPPRELTVGQITTDQIQLRWQPIPYTGDGGYYEVRYATRLDGPYTVHGTTADKTADGYMLDGLTPGQTYFIQVRTFTPAHSNQEHGQLSQPAQLAAVTQAESGFVLLILYFPADNDLSPYVDSVLERVRRGSELNPNVQVIFLGDKRGPANTRIFEVARGVITRTHTVEEVWGTDELDTSDPNVLAWFLTHARERFPGAARTVVSLMGHGVGMMPEFPWPTLDDGADVPSTTPPGIPALPKGIEATPGDVGDGSGYLSSIDFGAALAAATDNGANPFDVVFFDQCFQGNLATLYQVHRSARVLVASPNYAWLAAPYHQYLVALSPTATPELMADRLIRIYQGALDDSHPNVIFWVRGADIPAITQAVSQLGTSLQAALQTGNSAILATIGNAARLSQYVDTTQCGRQQFQMGPPDELLGAGSFASNLRRGFGPGDPFGIYDAAGALLAQLDQVESLARVGHPYLAPQVTWTYTDTITLLAPLRRESPPNVAWRASIFGATPPMDAIWTPSPDQTVPITQPFALAEESTWDEFIAAWYTGPMTPTVGEWCHYTPPVRITQDVTETLTLTVIDQGLGTAQVIWTATAAEDATSYWLLARPQGQSNWTVVEQLPLTQTVLTLAAPEAGVTFDLQVVAQDALGLVVAESNPVDWAVSGPVLDRRIYLPVVRK
ncbi:hypothetical protein RY27_06480 [Litorilinea aerophila]|nr:hypothetical protein RY27_06480 [Litorilinea aerophila]